MSDAWYEVWADEALEPPYLLVVLSDNDGKLVVFDPKENKIARAASDYEDAKFWLLEDEYTQVAGRMALRE